MQRYGRRGGGLNRIGLWLTVLALVFFVFFVIVGGILGTNYNHLGNLVKVFTLIQTQYTGEVDASKMVEGAIRGMVESLDDPYSVYLDEETFKQLEEQISGSFGGLGILVGVKDDLLTVVRVYEGTPADRDGVLEGDRITAIDGRDVRGMDLQAAIRLMRGPVGTRVELAVVREGKEESVKLGITREKISVPTVEGTILKDFNIGYMLISQFNEKTSDEVLQKIAELQDRGMQGLVLDLRNNPGGELSAATRVADNFVPKGPIVYIDYRTGDEDVKEADDNYLQLPLAVIINGYSASAAEILAGAIRDTDTGTLVGVKTFGKGVVQTVFPLDNGVTGLKLTTARYLTPDKNDINNKGIHPHVVVEDREDLPGDEQLDRAVELVRDKIGSQ